MNSLMNDFLWQSFITLFVIIDPIAIVPPFIALTQNRSKHYRRQMAWKSSLIAAIILLSFAFVGDKLFDLMGISEPAFRIAGGFLLLLAAIDMVIGHHTADMRSPSDTETDEVLHKNDISVFPMAIPLIAGPAALTSIVVLMRQAELMGPLVQGGLIAILLIVVAITYVSLLAGGRIMNILGATGTNVLTRVFGIILAALAVQNILNGIKIVVAGFSKGL